MLSKKSWKFDNDDYNGVKDVDKQSMKKRLRARKNNTSKILRVKSSFENQWTFIKITIHLI